MRYFTKPRTRKYVKGYRFLSFERNSCVKYGEKLIGTATKADLDAAETASTKIVHKTARATRELIKNSIVDKIVKPKPKSDTKSRDVDDIVLSTENKQEILNDLKLI